MEMKEKACHEIIVSENYRDYVVEYENNITGTMLRYKAVCYQIINEKYAVIHVPYEQTPRLELPLDIVPRLLGPYGINSLEEAGLLPLHEQPYVPLRGSGVIIGFVDSGIDYTQPVFVYEDNTTKILSIWDQTIQGNPPHNFQYGTEYTHLEINEALNSETPYEVVPSIDETGHGTFLAGIAAGRAVDDYRYVGAAPDAEIIMVKLKEAKNYIKEDYLIQEGAVVYQDNDVMMGISYLIKKASMYGRPLVICIGLGTTIGGHDGSSVLEEFLAEWANRVGHAIVICSGNEANLGHHYEGNYKKGMPYQEVELRVAEGESGVGMQLWAKAPDIFSVALLSPGGEFISRIPARIGKKEEIDLLLEESRILISYDLYDEKNGDELIFLQLIQPIAGIWTLRIYGDVVVIGRYNIWLEREGWILPNTQFINPNPYTTVTIPSTTEAVITVGAYDHQTDSLFAGSGRGWTRDDENKPDLVAPGVGVVGPLPNNQYGRMTGTSVAAAHVAGAAALLLEWGIVLGNKGNMETENIKKILVRGANRNPRLKYPNPEWGYGALDLLNSFEIIRGTSRQG